MKKRNLIGIIIAIFLVMSNLLTVASAMEIPENHTAGAVYVNREKVSGVTIYTDLDANVWIKYSDIGKVFPTETEGMLFPAIETEILLKEWADEFNYFMSIANGDVYLESIFSIQPVPSTKPTPSVPSTPSVPTVPSIPTIPNVPSVPSNPTVPGVPTEPDTQIPEKDMVKVYVNGMLVKTTDAYLDGNTVRLGNPDEICNILPEAKEATKRISITETSLEKWAKFLGYSYVQKGIRAYLNSDGQKPMEIILNDTILQFPDQQPYICSGRTLVPIRALVEELGWKVSYSNGKVTITNEGTTIVLWINSTTYTVNGVEKMLDVPARIVNSRTLVPIRLISETFKYKVNFIGDQSVNLVILTK